MEAELFTGKLLSRVFFKDVDNQQSHVIEQDQDLKEQESANPLTCIDHLVYIIVSKSGGSHDGHVTAALESHAVCFDCFCLYVWGVFFDWLFWSAIIFFPAFNTHSLSI